ISTVCPATTTSSDGENLMPVCEIAALFLTTAGFRIPSTQTTTVEPALPSTLPLISPAEACDRPIVIKAKSTIPHLFIALVLHSSKRNCGNRLTTGDRRRPPSRQSSYRRPIKPHPNLCKKKTSDCRAALKPVCWRQMKQYVELKRKSGARWTGITPAES